MAKGIIQVSKALFEQGETKRPDTSQSWHDFLMLPDTFRVLGVASSPEYFSGAVFKVLVESDLIPEVEPPTVTPFYHKEFNDMTGVPANSLDRIEYNKQAIWRKEA